jgi:hypothetical protein
MKPEDSLQSWKEPAVNPYLSSIHLMRQSPSSEVGGRSSAQYFLWLSSKHFMRHSYNLFLHEYTVDLFFVSEYWTFATEII